jgi:hypothetical protein
MHRILHKKITEREIASRIFFAGFLGGVEPVSFNWLANMPFGVDFNAFASLLFGTKDFPHSDVPMQKIVDRVADGTYKARPVKVFPFEQNITETTHETVQKRWILYTSNKITMVIISSLMISGD